MTMFWPDQQFDSHAQFSRMHTEHDLPKFSVSKTVLQSVTIMVTSRCQNSNMLMQNLVDGKAGNSQKLPQKPVIKTILIGGHLQAPKLWPFSLSIGLGGRQNSTGQNPKNPTPDHPVPHPVLPPFAGSQRSFVGSLWLTLAPTLKTLGSRSLAKTRWY